MASSAAKEDGNPGADGSGKEVPTTGEGPALNTAHRPTADTTVPGAGKRSTSLSAAPSQKKASVTGLSALGLAAYSSDEED